MNENAPLKVRVLVSLGLLILGIAALGWFDPGALLLILISIDWLQYRNAEERRQATVRRVSALIAVVTIVGAIAWTMYVVTYEGRPDAPADRFIHTDVFKVFCVLVWIGYTGFYLSRHSEAADK